MRIPSARTCRLVAFAAAALVLVVAPAAAEHAPQEADDDELTQAFADTDRDGDGYVSEHELAFAGVETGFDEVDHDVDGRLDQAEFNELGAIAPVGGGLTGTAGDADSGRGFGDAADAGSGD